MGRWWIYQKSLSCCYQDPQSLVLQVPFQHIIPSNYCFTCLERSNSNDDGSEGTSVAFSSHLSTLSSCPCPAPPRAPKLLLPKAFSPSSTTHTALYLLHRDCTQVDSSHSNPDVSAKCSDAQQLALKDRPAGMTEDDAPRPRCQLHSPNPSQHTHTHTQNAE